MICVSCRFKLLLRDASDASDGEEDDSEALVRGPVLEHGVIALPGTTFMASGGRTPYVRASFSLQAPEAVEEALRRLSAVVLEARAANSQNGKAENGA